MSQSDSRIGQVMDYVQQNGGNARALFYQMADQKGVDPNEVLNQVRSMM